MRPGGRLDNLGRLLDRIQPVADRADAKITAPTLLSQGEQDSLFPLTEADANARQIAANGTTVRVVWRAGGHDGGGDRTTRRHRGDGAKLASTDILKNGVTAPDTPFEHRLPIGAPPSQFETGRPRQNPRCCDDAGLPGPARR